MHVTTYDPTDPHAVPAYDGDPLTAWRVLAPGSYPCNFTSHWGDEWKGDLVVTPGGTFSHVVPDEPILMTRETFTDLMTLGSNPARFIVRQVGDGPITEYYLTRNGNIHVTENPHIEPDSLAARALQAARTHAQMTGAVSANWVEQDDRRDFALVGQWVREGTYADKPVIVA